MWNTFYVALEEVYYYMAVMRMAGMVCLVGLHRMDKLLTSNQLQHTFCTFLPLRYGQPETLSSDNGQTSCPAGTSSHTKLPPRVDKQKLCPSKNNIISPNYSCVCVCVLVTMKQLTL